MNIIGLSGVVGSGKSTVAKILVERHGFVEVALADEVKRIAQRLYGFTDEQLWGPSELRNAPDLHFLWNDGKHELSSLSPFACQRCGRLFDTDEVPCGLSPRHTLQQLGTEFGRGCHPDTWLNIALMAAQKLLDAERAWHYGAAVGLVPFTSAWSARRTGSPRNLHRVFDGGVVISDVRFPNELEGIRREGGRVWRIVRLGAGLHGAVGRHSSETSLQDVPDSTYSAVLSNDGTIDALGQAVAAALGSGKAR